MKKADLLKILKLPDAFDGWQPVYGTIHGWNGGYEILPKLIHERRPAFIIEVGAWLGLSTIVMAQALQRENIPDSVVLTVDTWLGSLEHWRDLEPQLGLQSGFPTLYPRFLHNVASRHCEDKIVPLPMPSNIAARLIKHYELEADLIFLDGSHDEKDVWDDLNGYMELLAHPSSASGQAGGVICGDDFQWPGVAASVKRYCAEHNCAYSLTPGAETTYWQIAP